MSTRVTASRIVGREPELAELEAALADAAAARPSLAFLAGESGVGKSRLLSELARRARAAGARVLSGDCVELGEGELPYAPIVAALRPLVRAADPVLAELAPADRAALARLMPGMGDAGAPGGGEDEAAAQARLFEALLALLDRLGRERPVLLALEDLHWADRSTRAFVAFLSRTLCEERVLLLASYRPDELHRRHPLRPLLAELERDVRARRIALEPLAREDLAALLGDIVGAEPEPALVERLWTRAAGNPLFTEELLAAGLDGRGAPPATLRDALMVRVERLGDDAAEVLRVLAAGQRLDHELLAEVAGLEPAALRGALREAVAGHIVVADEDGAYAFRHALLREVVHDDLLPGEHAELHRALAAALERRVAAAGRDAGAHLTAAVAHHHQAAGDRPQALVASLRAAAAAERVHAHGEAFALLERALGLWGQVDGAAELAGADHADVLLRAAQAADLHGDPVRGESLLGAAMAAIDPVREPRRAARVLERIARNLRRLARNDEALEAVRDGLALLPEGDLSRERARLLGQEAKIRMLAGRFRDGVVAAAAALEAARASHDRDAESRALNALGVCLMESGDVDAGVAALEEAREIARADHRPGDLSDAFNNLADVLHIQGRGREALAVAQEGLTQPTLTWHSREWLATMTAEIAIALGEWELAEAHLPRGHRQRTDGALAHLGLRRAELALGRGDHAAARAALDGIAGLTEGWTEPQFQAPYGSLRAELARREGDLEPARRAIDEALDRIEFCTEDVMRLAQVAASGVRVEADAVERARDLGDVEALGTAQDRLGALLERVESADPSRRPVETAVLRSARVDAARAAGSPDPALAAEAAQAWLAVERPYPAALMRWREAEAHLARGDRDAAAGAARAARDAAARLGAGWLLAQIDGLAARARLALSPATEPDVEPAGTELPFGLTPRELQVLALVAQGSTNREVGAALFMAEKTASVHVSRILAKLGVRSRTEAAAVAHRHGLAAALV